MSNTKRWLALIILCLGDLMIVLDITIVNVALPSIRTSLAFSETSLVWVVNAYMLTFGGCLLLGGRLGDLFGYRKLFLWGIALFTIASLLCGLANSQNLLICARAIQGIGGAIVSAVALSLIINLFTEPAERAKAMGIFGFVGAGGGSIGVFLGGLLTDLFSWHWIFLVNIPIGIGVSILSLIFLPKEPASSEPKHLDLMGAITITTSLMLTVYAIINKNLTIFVVSIILFVIFLEIEKRVKSPIMPLHLFHLRNVTVSNLVAVLWAAGLYAWFFISALYLQFILGYTPLKVGLAFIPANLIMAIFSLGISAKLVMKYGIKSILSIGLLCASLGLLLLARAPINGHFIWDVLPCMCLIGLGGGIAFNPMLLASMTDVPADESGIASGLVNTSFMMGGSVGLALLASIATLATQSSLASGSTQIGALNDGYHMAFLIGAFFAAVGSGLSLLLQIKNKS